MPEQQDIETARARRVEVMGGVELLTARYVRHRFSRHYHHRYALGCIEAGAMRFRYLGASHVASAGTVNLVVPGEAHDGCAAVEAGWRYRMLYLSPDALAEAEQNLGNRGLPYFRAGVIEDSALAAHVRAVHLALEDDAASMLEKRSRLLMLLTHWVHRHAEGRLSWPSTRPEPGAVALVREIIHAHFGEDILLDDLAQAAGLSPFHLLRVFQRQTGLTPHAYLTQVRMQKAKDLIAGDGRIADAAHEVGLADQSHLTRLFKQRYGLTPAAYRKILQNKA
ncbi:MAG: hypothetical protein PWQ57_2170 [Desulfovibrionales bacterium]|jgi:AraC-like DNA-binding protein|nr:hypothetical protein [Desulfovibrionales bacterium]